MIIIIIIIILIIIIIIVVIIIIIVFIIINSIIIIIITCVPRGKKGQLSYILYSGFYFSGRNQSPLKEVKNQSTQRNPCQRASTILFHLLLRLFFSTYVCIYLHLLCGRTRHQ